MERQIDLKEHQKIMLNILTDFANFCENHNLKYFIDSGTLLGAVRHQGFIPWDNDIDVNMPREDYDKFIQIIGPEKKINNHISVELPTDTMYTYCRIVDIRTTLIEFEKSYPFYSHIYIDLFPKDKLLCDGIRTRAFCRKNYRIGLWHWMHKYTSKKWLCSKNPIKKAVGYIDCLFVKNRNKSFFKQDKMIRKYERKIIKKNPQYITTLVLGEYDRKIEKEVFAQSIELMFEGRLFKAPIGYDKYLKCFYGDYMKLPPKEKQRIHHVSCWWNEVTHD